MGFFHQITKPPLSRHRPHNDYIIGLRGLLVIQSFLWAFLIVFAPASVVHSKNSKGPAWQVLIRNIVGVVFWNEGLIYSSFIMLSARTVCIPFLEEGSRLAISGSIFRRGIRLWIPVMVSLGIITLTFSQTGVEYIFDFVVQQGNQSIITPYRLESFLQYFNAVFNVFWMTTKFSMQAGNFAFPGENLWTISVIYTQSFTVYMTMVVVPYTRRTWRVQMGVFFILTAWWVQSWAWYSITGLLIADAVLNMDIKGKARKGVRVYGRIRISAFILYGIIMAVGLIMQYLWADWRPSLYDKELRGHTGLYHTGGLNEDIDTSQPQARDDNYFVVLGFLLFLESSDILQWIFSNPFLVYIGKRSLSWFLTQSIIIYTIGIKLWQSLQAKNTSELGTGTAVFFACLCLTAIIAESFYRLVEVPSHGLSHALFDWIRE